MNNQLQFYISIEPNVFQGRGKRLLRKNIKSTNAMLTPV